MPNFSAREMLSQLPVRMADGGTVDFSPTDQSEAYRRALESGGQEGVQAYYANLRDLSQKYMAGTDQFAGNQPVGVEAYNIMLEAGISNTDLINAGVGQNVLDKIFTTATESPQYTTPSSIESAFLTNPTLATEAARRSAAGEDGVSSLQEQSRKFVEEVQRGGITAAEQSMLRELALEGGYTLQDIQAAGVDPSILFNIQQAPEPEPAVAPPPINIPDLSALSGFTAPKVYQPLQPQPDIYAPGQPALDTEFRQSAPRTAIPEMPGYFDYTPAAQLRPATGAGYSWTPPSVTSRPRSLLSPLAIRDYGGMTSASQRFAQNRQAMDQAIMQAFSSAGVSDSGAIRDFRQRARAGLFSDQSGMFSPEAFNTAFGNYMQSRGATQPVQQPAAQQTPMQQGTYFDREEDREGFGNMAAVEGYSDVAEGYYGRVKPVDLRYDTPGAFFAQGGPVKKPSAAAKELQSYADGGSVETDFDALQQQLIDLDQRVVEEEVRAASQAPRDTDQEARTESRGMLERLNQSFYENVTQPVIGSALDMTVGLGDLAQLGVKKGAEALGMETKPFVPVSQRLQESAGVAGYDPYAPASIATQILPFARAKQAGSVAATQLGRMFPSLGRETAAYSGSELAAAGARELMPDSTAAELLASAVGGVGTDIGSTAMARRMADDVPPPDLPDTESSQMLDEIEQAASTAAIKLSRGENAIINEKVGTSRKNRQAAKAEAQRIKSNYSPAEGWAPIQVSNIKKDKKGNPNKVEFKKIPYGFQRPPEGVDVEVWRRKLTDGIVGEVDDVVRRAQQGDQAALDILAQANWYRGMRDQLRSEFGGIGDVFADILGTTSAQTNVEQNFKNAVEILRRYSRGEYDNELAAYQRRIDQGLPVDGMTLTRLHKEGEFPLITKAGGELFNTNSPSSMGALLDMFRSVKTGSSPKTPNFTGNLIGLTNEATVDVWAARMLRRMAEQPRIPPAAEKSVSGSHLAGSSLYEPRVGGEFGFGQDVFRDAARRINESGSIRSVSPELGDLGPDDLQAVAWFIEKERWTNNGWTTKAGEGGSLEYEMSLAGAPDQGRVDELRRSINQGFKTPARRKTESDAEYEGRVAVARRTFDDNRDQMQAELSIMEAPLQRYQLGVAGERPNQPMSGYAQAELASEFDDVARNDESVLTYNLANTYGSFMGDTERALNAEFVVRQNFNPEALRRRLVEQGRAYDQDAVFMSRVVSADTPNARPGVEIYFKESITPAQMAKVTERLREKGVDGFTYVTDMRFDDRINRQTRSGDPETAALTGLRFQYVPEFDEAFDPARSEEIYAQQAELFDDIVGDTIADGNVSDARLTFYDTEVYFRDDYDDYLRNSAPEGNREARRELATGADDPQSNRSGEGRPEPPEPVRDRGGQTAASEVDLVKSITEEQREAWRNANKGDFRQAQTPELEEAARDLQANKISIEDYAKKVEELRPIELITEVPKISSFEEIAYALDKNKVEKGLVGLNKEISDGTMVGSRLDIPAYNQFDTWVVSLHEGAGVSGPSIGYGKAAVLDDVQFNSNPDAALKVASGKGAKAPFARMNGKWRNMEAEEVQALAEKYLNDSEWTQVGMNPYRHSFFYDKNTGMPVASADQVIQIGPLVLAKNTTTRPLRSPEHMLKKSDPDKPQYFNRGGDVERKDDNRTYI